MCTAYGFLREAEGLKDLETAAPKTTERLLHQLVDQHAGMSRLEMKVTGLKARVAVLSSDLAVIAPGPYLVRQQLAARVSREGRCRPCVRRAKKRSKPWIDGMVDWSSVSVGCCTSLGLDVGRFLGAIGVPRG